MQTRGRSAVGPCRVVLVCATLLASCNETRTRPVEVVDIADVTFRLELALTDEQIRTGMMGRDHVADDEGMLFVFPEAVHRSFWMKNCRVDLDAIYLDAQGRVVCIQEMKVPGPDEAENPPGYPSRWPAQFVIELRGGRAGELNLKEGDRIGLPVKELLKKLK